MVDISNILSSTGVDLEVSALNAFGAAVGGTTDLSGLLSGAVSGSSFNSEASAPTSSPQKGVWSTINYAQASASGIGGFDPKNRFMFKVIFTFDPAVASQALALGVDLANVLGRDLTYVIKSIEMPKYSFIYANVNLYNFRTKVLTMVEHDELAFSMYDDIGNRVLRFINTYLRILNPISRQEWTTGADLYNHGMSFAQDFTTTDSGNLAFPGGVGSSATTLLSKMVIEQYFLDRSNQGLVGVQIRRAIKLNRFVFTNPRLTNFRIDEGDYAEGAAPSLVSCGFDYDSLHIDGGHVAVDVDAPSTGFMETNDILPDRDPSISGYSGVTGQGGLGGSSSNAFSSLVASQGQTNNPTLQSLLSNVGLSAGGGLSTVVNGALGTNAARTLASLSSGFSPSIVPDSAPYVTDDTEGGDATAQTDDGSDALAALGEDD